jgi:hypothetical protein
MILDVVVGFGGRAFFITSILIVVLIELIRARTSLYGKIG